MLIHQIENSAGGYNYNAFVYENCEWYYHFHRNYELIFVISGSITAMIDTWEETLESGDFALILPNQIHSYATPKHSSVWIGVFSEDYVFAFASELRNRIGTNAVFQCEETVKKYFVQKMIREKEMGILMLKSVLYGVCSQYLLQMQLMERQKGEHKLFTDLVEYISSNFKNTITLVQMADALGYESHYLSRRFHQIFHMNFNRFVNQYRLDYANELLRKEGVCISDVAFDSGFQSIRNFNKTYKEHFGYAPSKKNDFRIIKTM